MRYYISDLHFNHERLNEYMDKRGFADAEAMNEYMISQWNSRVRPGDEVVLLGDTCISYTWAETRAILDRLHGRKGLIIGNHDRFIEDRSFDPSYFMWVTPYKEVRDHKRKVILSHYPIFCYNEQYRRDKKGNPKTYMLYGHVHDSYDEVVMNEMIHRTREHRRTIRGEEGEVSIPCQMINCFSMFSDYLPLTLDEWIQLDKKRRDRLNMNSDRNQDVPENEHREQ